MVNSRRKTKRSTTGAEIKIGSNPVKDPDDITEGWCAYFTNLYRFTEDSSFDESFREVVDKKINNILLSDNTDYQQTPSILTDNLTYDELDDAIKSLPLNKAPG